MQACLSADREDKPGKAGTTKQSVSEKDCNKRLLRRKYGKERKIPSPDTVRRYRNDGEGSCNDLRKCAMTGKGNAMTEGFLLLVFNF